MRRNVRSVTLLGKDGRSDICSLGLVMRDWFRTHGIRADFFSLAGPGDALPDCSASDLVLILGGDGSFLNVARCLPVPKPLLGVNFGRVGFLADLTPDEWRTGFETILQHGIRAEWTLGLRYTLLRDGGKNRPKRAVNDIVITRGAIARLVMLDISINNVFFTSLRADGLIVSSPTGSTGYTGSARGPLLYPGLNAYTVTPICPFLSNFLPLVLKGGMALTVTIREAGPELFMTVDGQELIPLRQGDRIRIRGYEKSLCFARLDPVPDYFAKLRTIGLV